MSQSRNVSLLWHLMKSGFYVTRRWTAQWLDWEDSLKHSPKPNLHQNKKKVKVTVCGVLLPVWSATGFWILANPLHLRDILSKVMKCTEKSVMLAANVGQLKGSNSSTWQHPTTHHTTNTSKVEQIEQWSFASSDIFAGPLINWLPLLQCLDVLQGKCFHG